MLKKMKKNVEKYMYNTTVLSNDPQDQCYFFGYLDGYFEEQAYVEYIINSINNREKLEIYNTGYDKGLKDGKRTRVYNSNQYKQDRLSWIKSLALHDVLNNIEARNLKEETNELYKKYQNGTFHLRKMDFIEENRISKKR